MGNLSTREIQSLRILLVDDEPFIQSAIKQALANFGFNHIHTAENGEKALDVFDKTESDQSELIAAESVEAHSNQPISVHALRPSMRLASEVRCSNGDLLLYAGVTLSQRMISRLIELDSEMRIDGYYVEPWQHPVGGSVSKQI